MELCCDDAYISSLLNCNTVVVFFVVFLIKGNQYAALALPCNMKSSRFHAKWFMHRPMTRRCSLSYLGFSFFVCSEHITVTLGNQTTAVCCFGFLLSRKWSKLPALLGVFVLTAAFRRKNWPRLKRWSGSGKGPMFWSQHLSFSINQRAKDDEVCQLHFVFFCFLPVKVSWRHDWQRTELRFSPSVNVAFKRRLFVQQDFLGLEE